MPRNSDVMRSGEVAELFATTTESVRRWAKTGKLPSFRTPGGMLRFRRADVEAALVAGVVDDAEAAAS